MTNKCSPLFLILAGMLTSNMAHASFFDQQDGRFDMGHHIAENAVGFLPIPILITEPALGYGGGVAGLFLHEDDEAKEKRKQAALAAIDGGAQLVPAAITLAGAAGTENGSWFVFAGHRHSWREDRIRYTGGVGFGQANLDIYQHLSGGSIGPLPPFDVPVHIATSTTGAGLMQQLQFRVAETPLLLGVKQVLAKSSIEAENSLVDKLLERLLGKESVTSGLGIVADYDKRDNLFYPTRGYSLTAQYMVYDDALGSDQEYRSFALDGEIYLPLNDDWNLAFAGNYQNFSSDSAVTPTAKPYVALRGVSSYRYQGDEVAVVQTQLSYDIDSRWKVSAFYGYGEASSRASIEEASSVHAYGAGFRYQIARRYGLHLGIDVAFSDEEGALYFNIGSGL